MGGLTSGCLFQYRQCICCPATHSGDPLPAASFSGGPIKITNPAANRMTLSYTLDGNAYTISPGYSQEFREVGPEQRSSSGRGARTWNKPQYGLRSGLYSFTSTDHGWELYRSGPERSDLQRA